MGMPCIAEACYFYIRFLPFISFLQNPKKYFIDQNYWAIAKAFKSSLTVYCHFAPSRYNERTILKHLCNNFCNTSAYK